MTTGLWFVLCAHARAIPLQDLAQRIAHLRNVTIGSIGGSLQVAGARFTDRPERRDHGLSTEPHVVIESAEIAAAHANGRPDRAAIAAADARYEIAWDHEYSDEVHNTLAVIAEKLEKARAGVIFDTGASQFI